MVTPKGINQLAMNELAKLDFSKIQPYLKDVSQGSLNDINNVVNLKYYRYLAALVKAIKPKQVVELGSAGGSSALMMLSTLPKDSMLYACSIPEPEGEFRFIKQDYPNLTLIRGNDLDLAIWPKDCQLKETDLWFFDTDHNYEQLHAEMQLYDQFFKKGTIVLIDDIRLNEGMTRAWDEIKYPKLSLPDLHRSVSNMENPNPPGFGMFVV